MIYAHRAELPQHEAYRDWLETILNQEQAFGISELVLSSFLRIVTNPRVFKTPTDLESALAFVDQILNRPNCIVITPSERRWQIFNRLCIESEAKGNLIADAYLAALAIDSGCDWISADRDFSRFKGLKWHPPLKKASGQ